MRFLILLLFCASSVSAQPLAVTNTFSNNTVADAADINQNFADIVNGFNAWLATDAVDWNTALGSEAFLNLSGYGNTASGYRALRNNTLGDANTAHGALALVGNTIGYNNTASGYATLRLNDEGLNNTAAGYLALYNNNDGSYNTANGAQALQNNTGGYRNAATGQGALQNNSEGHSNSGFGVYALNGNTTGTHNTAIGFDADVNSDDLTNATSIGAGAVVSASNNVQIGNDEVSAVYLGRFGSFDPELANANLVTAGYVYAQGAILVEQPVISSDAAVKMNTNKLEMGLGFINALAPVVYERTGRKGLEMGFIAQDVREVMTVNGWSNYSLVHEQDESLSLRYTELLAPIIKAIQELDEASEAKDAEIASLKQQLQSQQEELLAIVQSQQQQIAQLQRMVAHQFAMN